MKCNNKDKNFTQESFNCSNIVSMTEYTGLIYPAIDSDEEAETYTEEFKINRQKKAEVNEKS